MKKRRCLKIGLGIMAGYYFLIRPRKKNWKKIKGYLDWHYAHRGLHDDESPENSLSSLKKAVEAGYAIEMDVRASKDGLVIHHDEYLIRSAGLEEEVDTLTSEELSKIKVFSSQETIPSLEEALEVINGRVPLLLEIKSEMNHSQNARRVQEVMDDYRGAYLIESFHPLVLYWYRKNKPQVLRGQLSGPELEQGPLLDIALKNMLFNFISRPDFIAYEKKGGWSPWLLHKLGTPSFVYTLLDPSEKKSYFDAGIFEDYLA